MVRRRRRGDRLGRPAHPLAHARRRYSRRFSSNKFGVVLKTCTPDDLIAAADRFLAAVREDVVQTANGPVATSVTIGGIAAPRHARTVGRDAGACAGVPRRRKGEAARLVPGLPAEHRARGGRKENVIATDKIITALNERAYSLPSSRSSRPARASPPSTSA
jgi:hypothetical protein